MRSAADWVARRDVSARIANVLDLRLRDSALQRGRVAAPNNVAVDHWMRGAYIMSRLKTKEELLQARAQFEAALALQPDSSHALAGLATTYVAGRALPLDGRAQGDAANGGAPRAPGTGDRVAEPVGDC